ncbi:uncharacterized protein A4U43_C03F3870 [Asparagus officinalis]|uniref:DNA mismatch repair protein Mlh1 C-terminal domain-containing protein n=1 Tax=Asparagus officinalis TaxID=4686 RepID=A0A5P1F7V2_ASPOF|nr:uncharacterized protein A4U43_C03F3870 [Asparagus officinalis]
MSLLHPFNQGKFNNFIHYKCARTAIRLRRNPKDTEDLTAVNELARDIDNTVHSGLWDIVKNCTYIGLADETFALLQYNTHLYLMNVVKVRSTGTRAFVYERSIVHGVDGRS